LIYGNFSIEIDYSKKRELPDGSVIVGDENGVLINGDFLLELLTKKEANEHE